MESLVEKVYKIANNGIFGEGKCIKVTLKEESNRGVQYSSVISFAMVTFNNNDKSIEIPITIKRSISNPRLIRMFKFENLFSTEVFMYNTVIPFLEGDKFKLFPKMFYGKATNDINQDIIILEDLTYQDFHIAKNELFLDYDHIIIALKKLAGFHAMSYIKKKQNTNQFYSIVKNLTDYKFITDDEQLKEFYSISAIRTINLLMKQKENDTVILNKIKEKLLNIKETSITLLKPEEPYAVICHGDFCRNNIVYRYDINKKPIDVKFFDLQTSIYSNPSTDLSFLLYLNTDSKLRNEYWDIFLQIYWDTLYSMVPQIEFTYKQFLEHFSKFAIFGLIPSSFFVPVVNEKIAPFLETYYDTSEVRIAKLLSVGNEDTRRILSDMGSHMFNNKYFEKFLELCE